MFLYILAPKFGNLPVSGKCFAIEVPFNFENLPVFGLNPPYFLDVNVGIFCINLILQYINTYGQMRCNDSHKRLQDCTNVTANLKMYILGIDQGFSTGGPGAKSGLPTSVVWPFDHLWNT